MPFASDLPGSLSRTFVCAVDWKENETHAFSVRVLPEPVAVHSLGDAPLLVFGSGLKQFTWVLGSTSPIMASFLKS